MVRPRKPRRVGSPEAYYFKPQGIPLRELSEVILYPDELEALKLHHIKQLNQVEAAGKMNISQSTFGRILSRAYEKITHALLNGEAIRIERDF